jgi:hypothetical protein
VTQITQVVAANEQVQRTNRELTEENQRLRGELTAIGSALGSLAGARRRRGRGTAAALALPKAKPRRQQRPITDPAVLARRNAALVAYAEMMAACALAALEDWPGRVMIICGRQILEAMDLCRRVRAVR